MQSIWVITKREGNVESLLDNGFTTVVHLHTPCIHIDLRTKQIYNLHPEEREGDEDLRLPNFNWDKYKQLTLLTSLGFSTLDALKELT